MMATGYMADSQAQNTGPLKTSNPQNVQQLSPVLVTGDQTETLPQPYAGGQTARGGRLGLLGNVGAMDTPFSVSSYTSQLSRDQQASTVADVLSRDASIRSTGQTGGVVDSFLIRGFPIGEGNIGEIALDGLYGVAPNYRLFTEYAERIEVVKGPAALLYGMSPNSGIGGVINVVPKRALPSDLTRFATDYASDTQVGGRLDLSRRFGAERQFGLRFNASHHEGDTAVDAQHRQADVAALALDYQGEKFRSTFDLISQQEKFGAPSRPFLVAKGVAVPPAPDGSRNVTQAWGWSKTEDLSLLLRTEYDLSDATTLFVNAGGARSKADRLSDQTPQILNDKGDVTSTPWHYKFGIERSMFDAGLRSRFNTGPVRHAITLQASLYRDSLSRGASSGTAMSSNIYNPIEQPVQSLAPVEDVAKISSTRLAGAALADTLSILDDKVQLTLGVRQQRIQSYNYNTRGSVSSTYERSAVTPMLGLVVKPWANTSLYANYIEGLSKGDIAPPTASNSGEALAPYRSRQYEVGVKFDQGSLMTTLSAFQITKASAQTIGTLYTANGEQRNNGLELSITGEATKHLRLLGSVTLIDATLTRTGNTATQGNTPVGVPAVQAYLGAEWDTPWVAGLALNGGMTFASKQYVDQANTQSVPSWSKFDLGARYHTRVNGKPVTLRANVLNVFNRAYWSGVASYSTFSLGAPRTVMLSAEMEF